MVLTSMLLAGCITVSETAVVLPNLQVKRSIVIDFTKLQKLQQEQGGEAMDLQDQCDPEKIEEAKAKADAVRWVTMDCRVDGAKVILSGTIEVLDGSLSKVTRPSGETLYRYRLQEDSVWDTLSRDHGEAATNEAAQETTIALLDAMYEFEYEVTMPGTITHAPHASRIAGSTAYYDHDAMVQVIQVKNATIESTEKGRSTLGGTQSGSHSSKFQQRVCARVAKFADRPTVYARVKARVGKRFGFSCSGGNTQGTAPRFDMRTYAPKRQVRRDVRDKGSFYNRMSSYPRPKTGSDKSDAAGKLYNTLFNQLNTNTTLADARDAQRRSDVNTILNAVYQYAIDHNGKLPDCIDTTRRGICTSESGCSAFDSGYDSRKVVRDYQFCDLDVLHGSYIISTPKDPSGVPKGANNYAGYDIQLDEKSRVSVFAPFAENNTISVTR